MNTFFVCALVTSLSTFTSLGFSIAAVIDRKTRIYGLYTLSRSLAISIVTVAAWVLHSSEWLIAAALVMILVQAFDTVIGIIKKSPSEIVGPAALSFINLAALWWYLV